jgi:putative transposase
MLVNKGDEIISLRRQCLLLEINRSSLYYQAREISEEDLWLMNQLDKQYTKTPFYGVRKMREYLQRLGYNIGKDKVRALLRGMGLMAIYPKPKTSKPHPEHKIYPYLLKDVEIIRPNQVWSADITYIRLTQGFAYLVVIIDWYSRYILSWRLSNSLETDFCIEALKEALTYGRSDIFNSDQGVQFTSEAFTKLLLEKGITISMDGRGRVFDNIFVERLWRSVKYENVYLHGYQTIPEAREGLKQYFNFYNMERFHQALGNKTPWEVYSGLTIEASKNISFEKSLISVEK